MAEACRRQDLADIPELPDTHRDHNRRQELRIKVKAANKANDISRYQLTMEAWTNLYAFLKKSTETTAPVLSRALVRDCDLSQTAGLAGGYFDGPLAWRMVLNELFPQERTEADKQYYLRAVEYFILRASARK